MTDADVLLSNEEKEAVLKALGQLALSASDAERYAAEAVYYLLTDDPSVDAMQGAGNFVARVNSMKILDSLVTTAFASDAETKLSDLIAESREFLREVGTMHSHVFIPHFNEEVLHEDLRVNQGTTIKELVRQIHTLYERRNQCLHSFTLDTHAPARLWKHSRERGVEFVSIEGLNQVCWMPVNDPVTLASVIEEIAHELFMLSIHLPTFAVILRWRRWRRLPIEWRKVFEIVPAGTPLNGGE